MPIARQPTGGSDGVVPQPRFLQGGFTGGQPLTPFCVDEGGAPRQIGLPGGLGLQGTDTPLQTGGRLGFGLQGTDTPLQNPPPGRLPFAEAGRFPLSHAPTVDKRSMPAIKPFIVVYNSTPLANHQIGHRNVRGKFLITLISPFCGRPVFSIGWLEHFDALTTRRKPSQIHRAFFDNSGVFSTDSPFTLNPCELHDRASKALLAGNN